MTRGGILIVIFALAAALLYGITQPAPAPRIPATFTPVFYRETEIPPTPTCCLVSPTATMMIQTSTPIPRPTPSQPLPPDVNGIPLDQIIVINPDVAAHIRAIYAQGQTLHRNPHAFSKIGDSTIENPYFLTRFDGTDYNLGNWSALQGVIEYYHGSFGRQGEAVKRGLHSWSALDPWWADPHDCELHETVVMCEFRANNPSIVFLRLGSNDKGVPEGFEKNIRQILDLALLNGIIPIIGTKADRFEGASGINNTILRKLADEYKLPLWDFDKVAQATTGQILDGDGVHLTTFYAHDYRQAVALQRGYGVHNLTALIALDAVWRIIQNDPS